MKLPPPPPLSGPALRALVSAAESKGTRGLVYKIMTKQMGITALLAVSTGDEPMPVDHRPVPFAGRAESGDGGDS